MSLTLRTNVASLNAQRGFGQVTSDLNKTLEKLSTGYKLNRAADGAGSIALADAFTAQVRGFGVAKSNIQQGQAMLDIADSALQTIRDDLQRYRELAVEAANGTVTDFTGYEAERGQIVANINAVANGTTFGTTGIQLLNGTSGAINIQAGANTNATDTVDISGAFADNTFATLAGGAGTAIGSNANATTAIGEVDTALAALATNMAAIGGLQAQLDNRLQYAQISQENFSAAEGVVRNVDVAEETSKLTQLQIVQQASALALSQANQTPNIALQLLR